MYSKGMILSSAIRQVRGLGDNKFEVVTALRTFIFRAEKEGTRSASFTLTKSNTFFVSLFLISIFQPSISYSLFFYLFFLLVSLPFLPCLSDSVSSLVFRSCSPLHLRLLLSFPFPSPPSLSVCLFCALTSLSLNASVVIFYLTSFSLLISLSPHVVLALPFQLLFHCDFLLHCIHIEWKKLHILGNLLLGLLSPNEIRL